MAWQKCGNCDNGAVLVEYQAGIPVYDECVVCEGRGMVPWYPKDEKGNPILWWDTQSYIDYQSRP